MPLAAPQAWLLWALASELLLAITHLKVLLCIGKPVGEQQLSNKRCTYFAYDLASPWLSLASLLAAPRRRRRLAQQLLAAATAAAALASGATPSPAAAAGCANDSMSSVAAAAGGQLPLLQDQVCNATTGSSSSRSSCPAVAPAPQALASGCHPQSPAPPAAAASMQLPSQDDQQQPLLPLPLQPLLLLMAGHAALHVFYIAAWHRPAGRNVLKLSAVGSMGARFRAAGKPWKRWEAAWFVTGTSADVATHIVLAGLLLGELLQPAAVAAW